MFCVPPVNENSHARAHTSQSNDHVVQRSTWDPQEVDGSLRLVAHAHQASLHTVGDATLLASHTHRDASCRSYRLRCTYHSSQVPDAHNLHVLNASAIDFAVNDVGREGIAHPLVSLHWHNIHVAVQNQARQRGVTALPLLQHNGALGVKLYTHKHDVSYSKKPSALPQQVVGQRNSIPQRLPSPAPAACPQTRSA